MFYNRLKVVSLLITFFGNFENFVSSILELHSRLHTFEIRQHGFKCTLLFINIKIWDQLVGKLVFIKLIY